MAVSIVLVPGFCSVGSVLYEPLKIELEALGYTDITIVDLPSVDSAKMISQLKPNAFEADLAHIRGIVKSEVEAGKDIIIAAHSYGGSPTMYAAKGLWKHERQTRGLPGGVLKTALISSSLTLPGETVAGVREAFGVFGNAGNEPPRVEIIDNMPVVYPENLGDEFFGDMAPADRKTWTEKGLRPTPVGGMLVPAPPGTVSSWRSAFLVTTEDTVMPTAFQEHLIESGRKAGAIIDNVKEIASGHFVQITHAKETAEWIKTLI